jgi:hypothetical protein
MRIFLSPPAIVINDYRAHPFPVRVARPALPEAAGRGKRGFKTMEILCNFLPLALSIQAQRPSLQNSRGFEMQQQAVVLILIL